MKTAAVLNRICCRVLIVAVVMLVGLRAEAQSNSPSTKPTGQQPVHVTQYQPEDTNSTEHKSRKLEQKVVNHPLSKDEIAVLPSFIKPFLGKMFPLMQPGNKSYSGWEWDKMGKFSRELAEQQR